MVTVARAHPDPNATSGYTCGSTFGTIVYDGLGRRIAKIIGDPGDTDPNDPNDVAGDWQGEFRYCHDGQRIIEMRNGSGQVLRQYVWGVEYIDELVQVGVNHDPANADVDGDGVVDPEDENLCERFYHPMHDGNYNVIGLIGKGGRLTERYEYTPYGQRTVFSVGTQQADMTGDGKVDVSELALYTGPAGETGYAASVADLTGDGWVDASDLGVFSGQWGAEIAAADPNVYQPRLSSFRPKTGGNTIDLAGLCDVGHQGLFHDREFAGLVHNRARMLHTRMRRFCQRDPLGTDSEPIATTDMSAKKRTQRDVIIQYRDGLCLYEYGQGNPVRWSDHSGQYVDRAEGPDTTYFHVYKDRFNGPDALVATFSARSADIYSVEIAAERARYLDAAITLDSVSKSIKTAAIVAEIGIRLANEPLDTALSVAEFIEKPSILSAAAILPIWPGGGKKLDDIIGGIKGVRIRKAVQYRKGGKPGRAWRDFCKLVEDRKMVRHGQNLYTAQLGDGATATFRRDSRGGWTISIEQSSTRTIKIRYGARQK